MNELTQGIKDLQAGLETPLANYAKLYDLISSIATDGDPDHAYKQESLRLLNAIRPRGIRLTVAALCIQDGKVLAVTRKADPTKVCMPGGFVDPEDFEDNVELGQRGNAGDAVDEGIERAAIREFQEETGLCTYECYPVFRAIDEAGTLCTLFMVHAVPGQFKPEPGTECLWLSPDEFMARCAWPGFYSQARKAGAF